MVILLLSATQKREVWVGFFVLLRSLSVPAERGADMTVASTSLQSCQAPRHPI